MKSMNSSLAVVAMAAAMFSRAAAAQQPEPAQQPQAPQQAQREIVVSLEDRRLALIENGEVRKIYTVAVGKPSTPSPEGTFTIQRRVANPTYSHNGKTVPPGPKNPVGSRWMGLSRSGYGIHGTNEPNSIGKAASHGCIRMAKADVEEFYQLVGVGDSVRLIGHRDNETARLFGPKEAPIPMISLQPLETARLNDVPLALAADPAITVNNTADPAATTVPSLGTR